ncbi:MAG: DNA replication and repair protein RecF [Bacteroidetes bacterium]|nr:DNA replication and repair protein RecF [Bacteroidota bacterium]MBU2586126.1 DNA replication and repair protein RecF [Bacteroidota bacterium]
MFLRSLSLLNFRLHKNTVLNFSEGLNYIVGGNGQGKTTVLEAIHYISTTKSFVANSETETLNFGETFYEIKANVLDLIDDNMVIRYDVNENKKQYALNGKLVTSPSEIIGRYPVVLLSPRDSKITEESPQDRRKFVDSIISQFSISYFQKFLEYKRILRQRASLLFQIRESYRQELIDELKVWTEKLIITGSKLIKSRIQFISEFRPYVESAYAFIMEGIENPDILYQTISEEIDSDIESHFRRLIEEESDNELRRATNLIGPHRDDYKFLLNGIDLKTFGSQGQHKTFQVALRFAEYFYLRDKLNKNPFFLLDDVFGDLDRARGKKISEHLGDLGQAFITLTDFTDISELKNSEKDSVVKVKNGKIVNAN